MTPVFAFHFVLAVRMRATIVSMKGTRRSMWNESYAL